MEIKLTPEWVFEKLTDSIFIDVNGSITLYANINNSHWIELALKTMEVSYKEDEHYMEDEEVSISFELKLDDIKDECPSMYKELYEMHINELESLKNKKDKG